MKNIITFILLSFSLTFFAQNSKSPVYPNCEETNFDNLETCFIENLKTDFLNEFKLPKKVTKDNFKGKIIVFFGISTQGEYNINYINVNYPKVKEEIQRVFTLLPKVKPAMYNGHAIESEYILPFFIPLEENYKKPEINHSLTNKKETQKEDISQVVIINKDLNQFPELNSSLTIPFTHQQYNLIDKYSNSSENEHATVKPYFYNETSAYKKVAADKTSLFKEANTALGKKTWNENLIYIKGKDYWFTVNPIFDWQVGKDNSDMDYTYNNTRAINVKGSIGKLSFSSSIYESQGRFAQYINDYMRTLKPANSYAVMLGAGNAKSFKDGGFDYPVAEGYVSYKANKHFTLQFGNGKNFIGDGYRSLFLSDAAAPYTFAKISTTFWKVKYTNIWMWANDVRPDSFINDAYLRKYVASHHLSINLTKRWNVGLFESTITNARSNPNMDVNFVNPIIFYRAVEFSRGSKSGNAIVGLNTKYKFKNANVYGQFVLDELTVGELFAGNGYWANKFGVQLGFHYFDAFKIKNLTLQGEANMVRPYTYSHNNAELNYAHYYQPLAHPWGSNFVELIGIARYQKDRWYGNFKAIYGKKGFDFDSDDVSYGGNIFLSYNHRSEIYNNTYYQGNTTNILTTNLQVGYIINPTTNLHIFANASFRSFDSKEPISYFEQNNTTWFSFGLKTDVFNSYFDF
jgi:hypothetical protein